MAIRIAGEIEKTFPSSMKYTKSELRAIARDAALASKSMKTDWKMSMAETRQGLAGVNKVGTAAFSAVAKTAKVAAAAMATATASSVKVGMDFESQMSTVKAISGATGSDFDALTAKAEHMGATTVFTATQSGEAMEHMAMAGWKTKDMLAGTKGIMDLAAASGEELGTTSDIVTDALTAFGLQAKDSTHFADVLAKTAASANTNVGMMGESFKYVAPIAGSMKYSIEDVSQVLGLMANSGIKASQAGTSTRSWLTRMAKPTKESEAAMKKLKISITDSHGKMRDLSDVVKDTRKAFAGLSETQKAEYAAMLAGKTGMSGLLAVVNSSEKDYKKLEKAIWNCSGAAGEMANTRLDNLKGDVTLFTSALQGAGIEIYNELKYPLRDLVQQGTEWLGDFAESFSTNLPTVIREVEQVGDAIGDFAEPFLDVGRWMLDNPDVLIGTIAGIGTALATYKVASGLMSLAESFLSLGTGAKAVLGAGAVIGVVTSISVAIEESEKRAAKADLDARFGDVALSMEELDTAARHIVGNGYLARVDELMDSKGKSSKLADSMKNALSDIEKQNWKIEAGIKLKKSDKEDYKQACKDYVKNAQEYITNQGYTVSVATKVLFGDGDDNGISKRTDAWYKGLDTQVDKLSKELNKTLNQKLSKTFTIQDKEKKVNQLLGDIGEITQRVADAQDKAKLDLLDAKYEGADLNADSFKNLQKEINQYVDEGIEGANTAYKDMMASIEEQKASGKYTDKKGKEHTYTDKMYQEDEQKARQAYYSKQIDTVMNGYDFMMGKVREKYGDDVDPVLKGMREAIQNKITSIDPDTINDRDYSEQIINAAKEYVNSSSTGLSTDKKIAMGGLLDSIAPSIQKLKEIQESAANQGMTLDQEVQTKIDNASREMNDYKALLYNNDLTHRGKSEHENSVVQVVGEEVWDNEKASQKMKDWYKDQQWGKYISDGIESSKKEVQAKSREAYDIAKAEFSNPVEIHYVYDLYSSPIGPTKDGKGLGNNKDKKSESGKQLTGHYALGGIITHRQIAELGEGGDTEVVIPINSSPRAISLWKQAGEMLGIRNRPDSIHNLSRAMGIGSAATSGNAGASSPISIQYSPKIVLQGKGGKGNKEELQSVLQDDYCKFEKMMKRYLKNGGRTSFKGGR